MYARELDGTVYEFGVSGKLIMNGLVMYDRQTETLWSQILGEAVKGPLNGRKLEALPATQTTWTRWRELHPDTKVLDKRGDYRRDPYASYFLRPDRGVIGSTRKDDRLPPKDLVVGLQGEEGSKAYPFRVLRRERVINDSFEGQPILAVFEPESGTGLIFSREVSGRVLSFEPANTSGATGVLRDVETGTDWDGLTGEAVDDAVLIGCRRDRIAVVHEQRAELRVDGAGQCLPQLSHVDYARIPGRHLEDRLVLDDFGGLRRRLDAMTCACIPGVDAL